MIFFTWSDNNGMKVNADKCHLLLRTKEKLKANISNYTTINSDKEKLVGVTTDNHLKFESHIKNLCSKASQKLYALSRVSLYMSLNQHRMIVPRNVGLLCNVVPGTFLCILDINYAMLTP